VVVDTTAEVVVVCAVDVVVVVGAVDVVVVVGTDAVVVVVVVVALPQDDNNIAVTSMQLNTSHAILLRISFLLFFIFYDANFLIFLNIYLICRFVNLL